MDLQENKKIASKTSLDISTVISEGVLSVIEAVVKSCWRKKQLLVTELDIFVSTLEKSSHANIVDQTGWKVLQQQGELIRGMYNRSFNGDVFLSPEAKLLLLNSYLIKKEKYVGVDDVLAAGIRTDRVVKAIRMSENLTKIAETVYTNHNLKPNTSVVPDESLPNTTEPSQSVFKESLFGEPHDLLWAIKAAKKTKSK